ncbi:MAG: hypothetical protein MEQ84_13270 [Mesorhizobium sp.]|nr:hypothetical protein [Mesorhizobium sp.]
MSPTPSSYVVSDERGYEVLETEDLIEAYDFFDELQEEGRSAAIGVMYPDGSTTYEFPPRRPAAVREME